MQIIKKTPTTRHVRLQQFGMATVLCIVLALNVAAPCEGKENVVFNIRICISFADSPIFTPLYKSGVLRHVTGQLSGYFGPLADCKIISTSNEHWLAEKMRTSIRTSRDESIEIKPAWLPDNQSVASEKVGFAYIDYAQSAYRIQLQVADVETGWISPLRTRRIPDRQMVAQVICEMFLANFPVTVTLNKLTTNDGSQLATVAYKGGVRMNRIQSKLDKNPYFKIYRKEKARNGSVTRSPIDDTVLYLDPSNTDGTGKVLSRYSDIFVYPNAEYEGISLPTQEGSVRLQIVDRKTRRGASNCIVRVSDNKEFDSSGSKVLGSPDLNNGNVNESPLYRDIIFVKIEQGGRLAKAFPVPLIEANVQLRREVDLDRDGAESINLAQALRRLNSVVNSLIRYQKTTKQESKHYYADQMFEKALQSARELSDEYVVSAATIRSDYLAIGPLPADAPQLQKKIWKSVKDFLAKQDAINQENQKWVKIIENLIAHNTAKQRAEAEQELGNQAKTDCGDVEEALKHYKKAKDEFQNAAKTGATGNDDAYAEQIEKLSRTIEEMEEVWRVKGDDHREAREFVIQMLQNADDGDRIEEHLPKLKQNNYIAVLQEHCDTYTLQKVGCICEECDEFMLDMLSAISDQEQSQAHIDELKDKNDLIKEIRAEARNARVDCQEADNIEDSDDAEAASDDTATICIPDLRRDSLAVADRSPHIRRGLPSPSVESGLRL